MKKLALAVGMLGAMMMLLPSAFSWRGRPGPPPGRNPAMGPRARWNRGPGMWKLGWTRTIVERMLNTLEINDIYQLERRTETKKAQVQIYNIRQKERDILLKLSSQITSGQNYPEVRRLIENLINLEREVSKIKIEAVKRILKIEEERNSKVEARLNELKRQLQNGKNIENLLSPFVIQSLKNFSLYPPNPGPPPPPEE